MMLTRLLPAALLACQPALAAPAPLAKWRAQAARVRIVRDDWGIAHVHGRSDADAVFGMIYAQAEDDFNRIEANYLTALGRTAEAEGEQAIWQDLRARLVVSPAGLKADYARSPAWLRRLMDAWADGLNFYLATHPKVKPRVIGHFEPWMALSFTEGSIGGAIEGIPLDQLAAFYGKPGDKAVALARTADAEPRGSNGFAIAPQRSASGHALLWINPHTSFFFRSELQMSSDRGLNAYGAATWGQFFLYQGFNATAGWMHTSSGVDAVDQFMETVVRGPDGALAYRYGAGQRPIRQATVTLAYRTASGMARRSFTTYATHHGPIVGEKDGKWMAFAMMNRPIAALEQSYLRTKAQDLAGFTKVAGLMANCSNNTIFADSKGNIAYLHPQFVPLRADRFDYTRPVDGSDPATDWQGLTPLARLPQLVNPASGWIQNTNNAPWSAAGASSQKAAQFPRYMDTVGENPRGEHATALLEKARGLDIHSLAALAFDPYQPAFARLVPGLVSAWQALPEGDATKAKLAGPMAALAGWDNRWSAESVPNTLASLWAEDLRAWALARTWPDHGNDYDHMAAAPTEVRLGLMAAVVDRLGRDFGSWQTPWGAVNRFQRLDDAIAPTCADDKPSIAVPFGSARWGSLASFGAQAYPGTHKWYGTSGNSFLAAVEFGKRVKAIAVSIGGESGDPASRHFNDQAARYTQGRLRPVYFYPDEIAGHVERRYRPGE